MITIKELDEMPPKAPWIGYREALKKVVKEIDKRIKFHEKHFNRYDKEVLKAMNEGDKSQLKYSENQAIKEIIRFEELKELKEWIKG